MIRLLLLLLLFDVHASHGVEVLSNKEDSFAIASDGSSSSQGGPGGPSKPTELKIPLSVVNVTDFTLCFRFYEHVYGNTLIK